MQFCQALLFWLINSKCDAINMIFNVYFGTIKISFKNKCIIIIIILTGLELQIYITFRFTLFIKCNYFYLLYFYDGCGFIFKKINTFF